MKKITTKTSKLVLLMVVGCFVGGYVTNVFSKDTAISWGNKSPNSTQKYGVLRVGISQRGCLYGQSNGRLQINNPPIQITRIGAFFSLQLLSKQEEKTKIGIRLIPYVINGKSGNRGVLVPNNQVSKFYFECYRKYQKIVSRFLKYYPIMLFKVDSEKNRNLLITRLKSLRTLAKRRFNEVNGTATTMGGLFQKVFRSKRVKFLEGLPFNVCVELIDEANMLKPPVKFHVINDETLPLPCNGVSITPNEPAKNKQPKKEPYKLDNPKPPMMCVEQQTKIDNLKNRIMVLEDELKLAKKQIELLEKNEKGDLARQINNARAKLVEIVEKNKIILKQYKQYRVLKKIVSEGELAIAVQMLFDSHPEILALDQKGCAID